MEEAITWVKRCPNPMLEIREIRPIFTADDFGEALTELREQEETCSGETQEFVSA